MTRKEVATMLEGTDIPNAYYQFTNDTAVPPPFICFYYVSSNDLYADDSNYQRIDHLVVELYQDIKDKDFDIEAGLEAVFAANELTFAKAEQYLDDERMVVEVYDIDVIITEEESNA